MSVYVLVHGAWHGGWCWKRVRKALQARGHEVFTPTLTGLGERSHLLSPRVDLETHINDVANLIRWEELSNVVLCGHSYAGCVISGVADRIADRIGALVYLDAFVLEDGQCLNDALPPAMRSARLELAKKVGEGWKLPPTPAETFNVNTADRDWVNRQCTMQPMATFEQRLHLTGEINRIENLTFIHASGWKNAHLSPYYEKTKAKGWKTFAMPCGHDIMLDQPDELTEALLAISPQITAPAR